MKLLYRASRLLIRHYIRLLPFYIAATLVTVGLFTFIPGIGILLALPLGISLAYITTDTIIHGRRPQVRTLFIAYKSGDVLRNLFYTNLRGLITYILTFSLSYRILQTIPSDWIVSFTGQTGIHPYAVLIGLGFIAFLPAVLIASAMSMVPFLLADPRFDPSRQNPLAVSYRILKGNFLRLLAVRSFFLLWYGWVLAGGFFLLIWIYVMLFGATDWPFTYEDFERHMLIYVISLSLHPFIIMPLKHVVHALLYTEIRHKAFTSTEQ